MNEKKSDICIWIHHTATFLGIFYGMFLLIRKRLSKYRICILTVFLETQIWGAFKIIQDLKERRSRLKDCYERIHIYGENEKQGKRITAALCCGSILFKLGVPWLAGRNLRKENSPFSL